MKTYMTKILVLVICLIIPIYAEPIQNIQAMASSADYKHFHKNHAFDGVLSDESRWIGAKDHAGKIWLELKLPQKTPRKVFFDTSQMFSIVFPKKSGDYFSLRQLT